MEYFHIIQALCRTALINPTDATIHQIERLKDALKKDKKDKEAKTLESLIDGANKVCDMAPSRIQRSFTTFKGEEITERTPLPVDKESSTPLVEMYFPRDLPNESPSLDKNVKTAISSLLQEWEYFDELLKNEAKPANSCLIYGAPGTGKTHLSLWIAKQLNLPVALARLDGLMSSFLGTTSRNIGNLFAFAAKHRCVLLLDEFDAIAKLRNDLQEVGEIKRVVNTLLQNLDSRKNGGFTIGITNHEYLLDPAIWRRFDIQIEVPLPSAEVMALIISKSITPLKLSDIEIKFLAWAVHGGSGADAEVIAKWIKKSYTLEKDLGLIEAIKKFTILNSARVNKAKKNALNTSDEVLMSALLNDNNFSFKQKDVALLLGRTPSAISKQFAKSK